MLLTSMQDNSFKDNYLNISFNCNDIKRKILLQKKCKKYFFFKLSEFSKSLVFFCTLILKCIDVNDMILIHKIEITYKILFHQYDFVCASNGDQNNIKIIFKKIY